MPKKTSRPPKIPSISRQVIADLYDAEALLDDGKPDEARQILEELDRRRPGLAPVLELLANTYFDLNDVHGYEWACYRLQKIEPNDPDLALTLGGAYMSNFRPALAFQALERFLRRWPTHEKAAEARQTIDKIRQGLAREMEELDLTEDEAFDLTLQNEEVRLFLEHGLYAQGRLAAEKLLKRYPEFVPAINNLGQIHAIQGDSGRAIQLCRQAGFLQLLQTAQNRHQKFQHFRLWPMVVVFLSQFDRLDSLGQPFCLGKLAPGHQKGVLSLLNLLFVFAHRHSLFHSNDFELTGSVFSW